MRADRKTDCDFNGTKKSISEKMLVTLVCLAGDGLFVCNLQMIGFYVGSLEYLPKTQCLFLDILQFDLIMDISRLY